MADLLAGHVPLMSRSIQPVVGIVKAGTLRALAVTTAERSALLPDVPTIAESGCRASPRRSATGLRCRPARRTRSSRG